MTSRSRQIGVRSCAAVAATAACTVVLLASALAQEVRPPAEIPTAADPAGAPDPNSTARPGFVDAVGRWFDEGTTKFKSGLQGAQHSFDQFADQTRDAASDATGAVMGLPNTRIVPVRERCAVAGNGRPPCQAAGTAAPRGKGVSTGESLGTQAEQK